jgi:hypothetical protein
MLSRRLCRVGERTGEQKEDEKDQAGLSDQSRSQL